jgi:flagellar hook-length control protein FliK
MLMMSPQNGIVIQKTKICQSREQRKYQAKKNEDNNQGKEKNRKNRKERVKTEQDKYCNNK